MQSPYPYASSYREGGRAASLLMETLQHLANVFAVYPTLALLIKLLIKAINSPNTKLQ